MYVFVKEKKRKNVCFLSLYKLLETFRALMKHPRQTMVAYLFTICSNSFVQYNTVFAYNIQTTFKQHLMAVPFNSSMLLIVRPCLQVSP